MTLETDISRDISNSRLVIYFTILLIHLSFLQYLKFLSHPILIRIVIEQKRLFNIKMINTLL